MRTINWSFSSEKPLYLQIHDLILAGVVSGAFLPGDRLPSVRDLAAEARVNPNTVQRAMAELEASGLVSALRTAGRYVTEDKQIINDLKIRYSKEITDEYLKKIKKLGFDDKEIIDSISRALIEGKETT